MANNMNENFYDILNIRKDASPEEIKKAYKNLAKQYHPDKNKAPDAAERFKMISRAHQVLGDPVERRRYDEAKTRGFDYDDNFDSDYFKNMFRNYFPEFEEEDPFTTTMSGTHEGFSNRVRSNETNNFRAQERTKEENRTRNTEFGRSGFSTRFGAGHKRKPGFDNFFPTSEPTSTKRPRHEPCSNTGSNPTIPKDTAIERPLELSLEEISAGCTKKLKIKRTIHDERGGSRQEERIIEIIVKAGWKAGTKLTYQNLGDKFPGREPADITFILKDKPHALFSRDCNNNLLHTAKVSLKKALLGVSYCIQGLNGERHDVNVKDIVHPGYVKRYPGEGLPLHKTPHKRGDLIVTFDIQFPTFLSWDQRRVLSDCLPN